MSEKINAKSRIIEDETGRYLLKQTNKDIENLFEYLHQRGFDYIPEIVETSNDGVKYKYVESNKYSNSKRIELAKILSLLHYKTTEHKDVSKYKYREIYDKLSEKIEYISKYYDDFINKIEMETYPSPSHYLIERNFSLILGSINFVKSELKRWFKLVEEKLKERVCIINNNPKINHLIIGEREILTNWDNYMVDTPIIDLYKLYKNDNNYKEFNELYKEYNENFKLTEEEKKLFFIMISIPPKIEEVSSEITNTKNAKEVVYYLYKTNEFIKSINSKKEINNKSN